MSSSTTAIPSTNGTNGISAKPVKTREVHNHHADSTIWNDFKFRPGDIIIATWAKSGTTWMQQIVSQLVFKGDAEVRPNILSPWVDARFQKREELYDFLESQNHRRFMKTHLPINALPWKSEAKYIFVARDGRDMIWSLHHHMFNATPAFFDIVNNTPGRVGPECRRPSSNPRDIFLDMVDNDVKAELVWPLWSHIGGYWAARHQPNLLLVHFADLKADLDGEMRRIAKFLDIPEMPAENWKAAVEHCTFDWMKEHASNFAPPMAAITWEGGAKHFINKGTNGRWKDVLSEEDNKRYAEKVKSELGEECARWLEHGGHVN
ncbi:P-loop containing nucleoside triphosphate hydrolase protein [Xylariaceae sp. FL0255]|nr:P-loop containing nucleoside triphosphate hydrolase protein [Xylariaceae sp. FL0255]